MSWGNQGGNWNTPQYGNQQGYPSNQGQGQGFGYQGQGFNQGYGNQGFNQGYNQGFNQGYNQGFNQNPMSYPNQGFNSFTPNYASQLYNPYNLNIPMIQGNPNCRRCHGTTVVKNKRRGYMVPCSRCYKRNGYCKKCFGSGINYKKNMPCKKCYQGRVKNNHSSSSSDSD